MFDLANAIVGTFDPKMPEASLIQTHLKDHVDALYTAMAGVVEEYTI